MYSFIYLFIYFPFFFDFRFFWIFSTQVFIFFSIFFYRIVYFNWWLKDVSLTQSEEDSVKTKETEIPHNEIFYKNSVEVVEKKTELVNTEIHKIIHEVSTARTFVAHDARTVVRSHQQLLKSPSACSELFGWGLESGYNLGLGLRARPGLGSRCLTVLLTNRLIFFIAYHLFVFLSVY